MEIMPDPIEKFSGQDIHAVLRTQLEALEAMLEDPGLIQLRQRWPLHPAVRRHTKISELLNGVDLLQWPDEFDGAAAVSMQMLDTITWLPVAPYESFWDFLDSETSRWTLAMLRNPDHFEDVMAELFTWGWLRKQGFEAERLNTDGTSDVVIDPESNPYRCEVKRIRMRTNPKRVGQVITKANKQIKNSDPEGSGTAYISIARTKDRIALDDRIPNDVEPYISAASDALRAGKNRSVAQVILMWEDVLVHGSPPAVLYAFRRRSKSILHPEPRTAPKYSAERLTPGMTATVWVRFERVSAMAEAGEPPDSIESPDVVISSVFRKENEFVDGLRARQAIEAFHEPDALTVNEVDGATVFLATREVEVADPFTMLLCAYQMPEDDKVTITGGYRLYRADESRGQFSTDPQAAFDALIDRYGLELRVAGESGKFIERAIAKAGQPIEATSKVSQLFIQAIATRRRDGTTDYRWIYGLDMAAYRGAVRRRES